MINPNGTSYTVGLGKGEKWSTMEQLFQNLSEKSTECLFSIVCACNNKSRSMLSMQVLMLSTPISKLISTYDCYAGAVKKLHQKLKLKTEKEVSI